MSSPATVLVIDDDPDFRSLVREELAGAGYGVTEASGGHEGVAMLRQADVDVVLLDVQMPGLNGHEVLREARNLGVHSEVVVMTAYPQLDIAMSRFLFDGDRRLLRVRGTREWMVNPDEPNACRVAGTAAEWQPPWR